MGRRSAYVGEARTIDAHRPRGLHFHPGEAHIETTTRTRLARAFCSAQDRNVPVLRRDGDKGRPNNVEPELITCLEYGVRCTGWLCPLFSLPTLAPEELLEEAIARERQRKQSDIADGRSILERALRERRGLEGHR